MWSESLAAEARIFFNTSSGKNLLIELASSRPSFQGTTMEEKAISGSIVEGFETAQEKIELLVNFKDIPSSSTSPSWIDMTK